MWRYWKSSLRPLKPWERDYLNNRSISQSEATGRIIRAKVLLALADGKTAAKAASASMGVLSEEDVYRLIANFNREGLKALNYSSSPNERSPSGVGSLFHKLKTVFKPATVNPRRAKASRQNKTPKPKTAKSSFTAAIAQTLRRLASSISTNSSRAMGSIRLALSSTIGNAQSKTSSFLKTRSGLIAIIILIALISFGIWRLMRPNPFDPGYVALQPVDKPTSPDPDAAIEPIESSLPSTQFSSSVPEYIPVIKASEKPVDASAARIKVKNTSARSITFSFKNAQTGQFYSVDVQAGQQKTLSVPSGTYKDFYPPINNQGETTRYASGGMYLYTLYVKSIPYAPDSDNAPSPFNFEPLPKPPRLQEIPLELKPRP